MKLLKRVAGLEKIRSSTSIFAFLYGLGFVDKIPHLGGLFRPKGQHSADREPACFLSPNSL
jgi:hypothetical protein